MKLTPLLLILALALQAQDCWSTSAGDSPTTIHTLQDLLKQTEDEDVETVLDAIKDIRTHKGSKYSHNGRALTKPLTKSFLAMSRSGTARR